MVFRALRSLIFVGSLIVGSSGNAQTTEALEMLEGFTWVNRNESREVEGIEHRTFFSDANKTEVGFYIAWPAGYSEPARRGERFPVIYFLHGGRPGAEHKGITGFKNFRASRAGDQMPPHIFVMVNGGKLSHYDYIDGYLGAQAFLELVKHLDATERTIATRHGRVLMGNSQGGRAVGRNLLRYPDLFGTGVSIAGGHQRELTISQNAGSELNGIVIPDASNNVYDHAIAYAKQGEAAPLVNLMVIIGNEDENYPGNLRWCAKLAELGIKHELIVVPGTGHGVDFDIEGTRERVWRFMAAGLNAE